MPLPTSPEVRRPTLRDVAHAARVSPMTASRILNGSADRSATAQDTRRTVEAAARALGYRVHAGARAMRRGRSGQIGLVVINRSGLLLTNLPAYEYILGLNVGLEEAGQVLTLVRITDADGHDPRRVRALREQRFDAYVVAGLVPPETEGPLADLAEGRTVWLDTNVDAEAGCLRRDEHHAGAAATDLLLARGRRRIVFFQRVAAARGHFSHEHREQAVRERCRAAGAEVIEILLEADGSVADPPSLRRLLADPRVGILAVDPAVTRAAQTLLLGFGLIPGTDLGFASCDIDEPLQVAWPGLSGVAVDRAGLGRRAAAMVQTLLADGVPPASETVISRVNDGRTA